MKITSWKRALGLGFLSWLLPFLFAFPLFPLKQANQPLFDTVMSLAVIAAAALLGKRYFRGVDRPAIGEALMLGVVWLAINLVCDYPMFSYGPMKMSMAQYYSEIGAGYLLYPAFFAGAAWVVR
jgi:hypothetical protein